MEMYLRRCYTEDIKGSENLTIFKSKILIWKPDKCHCRLCKTYLHKLFFHFFYLSFVLQSFKVGSC